jgi:actinorhodin biosynthesis protein ActVIA
MSSVTAELYVEVQTFFAKQMRLLDNLKIEEYAATFTPDGEIVHAHRDERAKGRETMIAGMYAALPRYKGVVVRHWFDHLLVEPAADGSLIVNYYTLVTRCDAEGKVVFEPTFTVTDTLVRGEDGQLYTQLRYIEKDTPPLA